MLRIDDLNINYKIIGDGDLVVLLHGWGQNIELMQPLVGGLEDNKVFIMDLPGFLSRIRSFFNTPSNLTNYTEYDKIK